MGSTHLNAKMVLVAVREDRTQAKPDSPNAEPALQNSDQKNEVPGCWKTPCGNLNLFKKKKFLKIVLAPFDQGVT
jgi:hypothetical protein